MALLGRPQAAAAGRHDHQPLASAHQLRAFSVQFTPPLDRYGTRGTRRAPGAAARRKVDTIEGGQQLERLADTAFDFDDLAEAPPRAPGPSRAWAQLLLPENQGRDGFRDLDRRALDAGRISGGR